MMHRIGHGGTSAIDMTSGSILGRLVAFSLPLLLGNMFQMFYNTVDSLVVGNYVGKQALAAVGSTGSIINVAVFFFNGISIGAGVVISRLYGARDNERLHVAVETTMTVTFVCCLFFTALGVPLVPQMLRLMSTPDDVMGEATLYLRIYFAGIAGLLIYNMGSGILRAVGDSKHPLYFLILSSLLNVGLDLYFVKSLGWGIAGVGYATILSQFVSATAIMLLLLRTKDIYRFSFRQMGVDRVILSQILSVGLPAALQSTITAFSNVFVQGYINSFGSDCMAGWSCFNKLEQFVFLPINSVGNAATTFVSQNIGARQIRRAGQGTVVSLALALSVTGTICAILFAFSSYAIGMFSPEASVVEYGVRFLRLNIFFLLFNCTNHVMAGSLRGRGDAKGPMIIMLACFVGVRQLYLLIGTHLSDSILIMCFAYPVGWVSCCILEVAYYLVRRPSLDKAAAAATDPTEK